MDKSEIYKDIANRDEIIEKLNEMIGEDDYKGVYEEINKIYPTWIINIIDNYSEDYKYMDSNWEIICKNLNVSKKKIILVDFIIHNSNDYKIIENICEKMTKKGFVIRRVEEFVQCVKCERIIPCKFLWEIMKIQHKLPVPENWSNKCTNC